MSAPPPAPDSAARAEAGGTPDPFAAPPPATAAPATGSATADATAGAPGAAATAPARDAAAAPSTPVRASAPRRGRRLRIVLSALALLAVAAAALAVWRLRTDLDLLRTQIDDTRRDSRAAAEQAAQSDREAQLRIGRLEAEVERQNNRRGELDTLYLDLTRGRDEAALVEVERLVTLAAQELQITGNVPTALAALQSADARLARIDRPQLVNLRRAIVRDIERLRAVPAVDFTGIAVKLDQMVASVDGWPLLADAAVRPAAAAPPALDKASAKAPAKAAAPPAAAVEEGTWARVRGWLKDEFGDLVRVREVDTPEALLLTAQQQQLARQQMRLRLLNARHALLTRNDRLFRADLSESIALLNRYFDTRQATVATAAGQLKTLAGSTLSVDVPQLADSIGALRQARPATAP